MADNVIADSGDSGGATFATDDIGPGVHYPLTKITLGALDANDGPVATGNPMPVELTDDNQTVVSDIADIEDNTDSLAVVGGGVEATALRVTLASDSTGVVTVDGTVTAELSGTDNGVLDAIAASLVTIDSDTNDIKTAVEIIDDAVAAEGDALGSGVLMQGDDGTDRTNVLVDTDGHIQVDVLTGGGAGTQYTEDAVAAADPVGGVQILVRDDAPKPVAADGDNVARRGTEYGAAYTQILDSAGNFIDAFSGGTQYTEDVATANPQVGTATMVERDNELSAVTPAEGDWIGLRGSAEGALWTQDFNSDASLALLGTMDADTGAIKTAVEALDDAVDGAYLNTNMNIAGTDVVGGAGVLAAGVQRVTIATDDEVNNFLGTIDADTGAIKTSIESIDGALIGPGEPTIDSYSHVSINLTTGANQVIVSSAPSKQIWVYGYAFSCGDANGQSVSLQDEDDTAVTGVMEFAQYGGISVAPSGNFSMPAFKLGTDKDLEVDILGGDVDGWLAYAIVSV